MPPSIGRSSARPIRKTSAAVSGPGAGDQTVGTPSISVRSIRGMFGTATILTPACTAGMIAAEGYHRAVSVRRLDRRMSVSTRPGVYSRATERPLRDVGDPHVFLSDGRSRM
jgi:hypothetical protein